MNPLLHEFEAKHLSLLREQPSHQHPETCPPSLSSLLAACFYHSPLLPARPVRFHRTLKPACHAVKKTNTRLLGLLQAQRYRIMVKGCQVGLAFALVNPQTGKNLGPTCTRYPRHLSEYMPVTDRSMSVCE